MAEKDDVMGKVQNRVPRLRFPGFEGEWDERKVGELCDYIVPGRNKPSVFDGEIPWITTPDIEHNQLILYSKKGLSISEEEAKRVGSKIVPENSIIISCVGELGLAGIAGTRMVINQQLHAFVPKNIDYKFLLHSLGTRKDYMEKIATKTAVPYMNKYNCNSIPISFPKYDEQKKIANFLSLLNNRIQTQNKIISRYQSLIRNLRDAIFRQKITLTDSEGTSFSEWENCKLKDIAVRIIKKNTENEQNVLTISAQLGLVSQLEFFNKSVAGKNLLGYYLLEKNDFAYNKSYSAGYSMGAIKRLKRYEKGVVSTLYICFRFKDDVCQEFMEHYFESQVQNDELEKIAHEGARNHGLLNVGVSDFFNIEILLPSIREQLEVAKLLSTLMEKVSIEDKIFQKLKNQKNFLLKYMLI